MRDHAGFAGWFKEVAAMNVVKYETAAEAKDAEKQAIQTEKPVHNIQWNALNRPKKKKLRNGDTDIEKRIEKARESVKQAVGHHREIAAHLGVSYSWVRRFASGALQQPGAVHFAHLEEWLAKHI
jgi:hypothetical protein